MQYKGYVRDAKKRALDTSTCTVARKRHRNDGDEEGAGEDDGSGADENGSGAEEEGAVSGADADAQEDAAGAGSGEDAGGGAEEGVGDIGAAVWRSNALQLYSLLKKPLEQGRAAFLKTSPEFQEWVWERLDCWKAGSTQLGDADARASIERLVELCKPFRVLKEHPLDGLVTWTTAQAGTLTSGFKYRAVSIWRRVTRGMSPEQLGKCVEYTSEHIERIVDWHRDHSVLVPADQSAKAVKTAFKEAFGCMNPHCSTPGSALEVDYVNPAFKTATYKSLINRLRP